MPISIEWDPDEQLWTLTCEESFTLPEAADLVRETDWRNSSRYLWDLRRLVRGPDATDEIQNAVDLVKAERERWAGTRVAIVVAREFDFGIARMFQTYADGAGVDYQVFREHGTAIDWLTGRSTP